MCHRQLYVSSVVKLYTDNNLEQRAYDVRVNVQLFVSWQMSRTRVRKHFMIFQVAADCDWHALLLSQHVVQPDFLVLMVLIYILCIYCPVSRLNLTKPSSCSLKLLLIFHPVDGRRLSSTPEHRLVCNLLKVALPSSVSLSVTHLMGLLCNSTTH